MAEGCAFSAHRRRRNVQTERTSPTVNRRSRHAKWPRIDARRNNEPSTSRFGPVKLADVPWRLSNHVSKTPTRVREDPNDSSLCPRKRRVYFESEAFAAQSPTNPVHVRRDRPHLAERIRPPMCVESDRRTRAVIELSVLSLHVALVDEPSQTVTENPRAEPKTS
jgi:hypothetical protein